MSDTTITSANSIFTLVAGGLFTSPVQLRGYSSDKAFATDAQDVSEVNMGVDGRMTAGFTPTVVKQTVTLQADSPSREVFAAIIAAMKSTREIVWLTGVITLPATGETYALTRGVITSHTPIPSAQKVLQPLDFVITWEASNRSII